MDTSRAEELIDPKFLDASFRLVERIPDYNGRIWEHLPGWSCGTCCAKPCCATG